MMQQPQSYLLPLVNIRIKDEVTTRLMEFLKGDVMLLHGISYKVKTMMLKYDASHLSKRKCLKAFEGNPHKIELAVYDYSKMSPTKLNGTCC